MCLEPGGGGGSRGWYYKPRCSQIVTPDQWTELHYIASIHSVQCLYLELDKQKTENNSNKTNLRGNAGNIRNTCPLSVSIRWVPIWFPLPLLLDYQNFQLELLDDADLELNMSKSILLLFRQEHKRKILTSNKIIEEKMEEFCILPTI